MGQRILIDTTMIIKYLRARRRSNTTFAKAIARYNRCFLSTITVYEVEFGAARVGRMSDLYTILPVVEVLALDQQIAA
jgi:predicted nucleic acid-binding protein